MLTEGKRAKGVFLQDQLGSCGPPLGNELIWVLEGRFRCGKAKTNVSA